MASSPPDSKLDPPSVHTAGPDDAASGRTPGPPGRRVREFCPAAERVPVPPGQGLPLLAACDGEALEPVHRGLNAVLDDRRDEEIVAALARLGAVGHSSGWDAFSGALAVVDSWQCQHRADPH